MSNHKIAENLTREPKKPCLKRPSIENSAINLNSVTNKHQHYDEENVKATYGPGLPNKDYGHQKIEEAKTPFVLEDGSERSNPVDTKDFLEKLNKVASQDPSERNSKFERKEFMLDSNFTTTTSASKEENIEVITDNNFDRHDAERKRTPEEQAKRSKFEQARKGHYNMREQMLLARKLMEEEDDDDDDDE